MSALSQTNTWTTAEPVSIAALKFRGSTDTGTQVLKMDLSGAIYAAQTWKDSDLFSFSDNIELRLGTQGLIPWS